ncbi:MAG: c-di-GMP phosphodiesterase, partial [Campylobacterota bacterium]|nr:c-di-GMP phosphodiesterase [Campylobacterota bacterium]
EEVIGNTHDIMTEQDSQDELLKGMKRAMEQKKTWNGIVKNITKNGTIFYTDTTIVPIIDESNQIIEYIAIRKDISDLYKSKQKLIDQLYSDNLTGLPNRLKLIEDLKNKENKELFMVLINIDRFKEINDYYGYDIGDKLLISLKDRLLNFSEKIQASVYRVHADEFAILIKKDDLKKTIDENVEELHKEVDDKPYKIKDDEFNLNITIGASAVDKIATKEENDLLVNADLALRSAKKEKKDFLVFDSTISLKKESEENLKWTQKLKDAIKNDRIISYFQPIYDNKAKDIKKKRYECLMRLVENDGSIVSPFAFLNIAKKAKLYTKLTKIMVEKAFETFKDKDNFSFSINISAEDILDKNTASFIKEKVKESPVAKNAIFEIVESEGIENFSEVKDFIDYVKSFGCKIAIDDFGTGYSNFEYLTKLNIDIIKIDGSLIKNITSDKDAQTIVKTIIEFAKELNIEIVAEYVHSKEVQKEIENLDIKYSQGFYLSEPKNSIS